MLVCLVFGLVIEEEEEEGESSCLFFYSPFKSKAYPRIISGGVVLNIIYFYFVCYQKNKPVVSRHGLFLINNLFKNNPLLFCNKLKINE